MGRAADRPTLAGVGLHTAEAIVLAEAFTFAGKTLVGVSRMYDNKHRASDVVIGAALGTFSGWKVVACTHSNPRNPVDRILLRTSVVPAGRDGVLLAWTAPL